MSTPASERRRAALAAAGVFVAALAGAHLGLSVLAGAAERDGAYPFRSEDWLRYLLPALHGPSDRPRLLLAGESAVRENLLVEPMAAAFPHFEVVNGGFSLATLDDVLLGLEFVEGVYGPRALPRVLVVGFSPRFVAGIAHGRSPFAEGLDAYSARFRVVGPAPGSASGSRLAPKSALESWRSRRLWLGKQRSRYRTGLAWAFHRLLPEDVPYERFEGGFAGMRAVYNLLRLRPHAILPAARFAAELGPAAVTGRWLRLAVSPHRYHWLEPMRRRGLEGWLNDPTSFWGRVHSWDPGADALRVRAAIEDLVTFTGRHGIALYSVNLPENWLSRKRYDPERYAAYLSLLRESLGTTPFLDLGGLLVQEEFYDVVHATLPGARKVTEATLEWLRAEGAGGLP